MEILKHSPEAGDADHQAQLCNDILGLKERAASLNLVPLAALLDLACIGCSMEAWAGETSAVSADATVVRTRGDDFLIRLLDAHLALDELRMKAGACRDPAYCVDLVCDSIRDIAEVASTLHAQSIAGLNAKARLLLNHVARERQDPAERLASSLCGDIVALSTSGQAQSGTPAAHAVGTISGGRPTTDC